jgi:hypothetical protein
VSSQAAAETLGGAGNVIMSGENAKVAEAANQGLALYDKLSTSVGPIEDALNKAAQSLADGEKESAVRQRAYTEIRAHLREQVEALAGGNEKPGVGPAAAVAGRNHRDAGGDGGSGSGAVPAADEQAAGTGASNREEVAPTSKDLEDPYGSAKIKGIYRPIGTNDNRSGARAFVHYEETLPNAYGGEPIKGYRAGIETQPGSNLWRSGFIQPEELEREGGTSGGETPLNYSRRKPAPQGPGLFDEQPVEGKQKAAAPAEKPLADRVKAAYVKYLDYDGQAGSWDTSVAERTGAELGKLAESLKTWRSSGELGRAAGERGRAVIDRLGNLVSLGFARRAWNQQGQVFYGPAEGELPAELSFTPEKTFGWPDVENAWAQHSDDELRDSWRRKLRAFPPSIPPPRDRAPSNRASAPGPRGRADPAPFCGYRRGAARPRQCERRARR